MPRIRKQQCESFDEVCKLFNNLYARLATLAGQKSAKGVKALQAKVAELEVNQEALHAQIIELKLKPEPEPVIDPDPLSI